MICAMYRVVPFLLVSLLYIGVTEGLEGNNISLCYEDVRITKRVELQPEIYTELTGWSKREYCCKGYEEIDDACKPVCTDECLAGECIEPDKCECFEGFTGHDCSTPVGNCISGMFGEMCDKPCECNDSPCNRTTGLCTCSAGRKGNNCESTCSKGKFGPDCTQDCTCQRGDCDPATGQCECPPGYTGEDCSKICDDGSYGEKCEFECSCRNGAKCDHVTGECHCSPGYQGWTCSSKCNFGKWGDGCSQDCDCKGNTCDNETGDCQCKPGYRGEQCGEVCDVGFYGKNCSLACWCVNGDCSHIDGTCTCHDGWTGLGCEQKNCTDWTYGLNCEETCKCDRKNTKSCNLSTGGCTCNAGWTGETCEDECPRGYYGDNCSMACDCVEGNYESCDKKTGQCFCKKAWKGQWCGIRCDCQHGGECDPNGRCNCTAGWQGELCNEPCKPGYYGRNCQEICLFYKLDKYRCDRALGDVCITHYEGANCEICTCGNGICNSITESCDCLPGYYGLNCTSPCPKGSFGQNCSEKCACPECRATDGFCPCQPNWNGTLCTDYCPVEMYNLEAKLCQELAHELRDPGMHRFIAIAVTVALLIIIIVTASVLLWRRNKAKRDNECTIRDASKFYAPDNNDRSSRITNTYERDEPTYEVIPEISPVAYDSLAHFGRRHDDPLYYTYRQYELPRNAPNCQQEYIGLNTLDERPNFDAIPECDRVAFMGPSPIGHPYSGNPEYAALNPLSGRHNYDRTSRAPYQMYASPSTFQR